MNKRIFENLPYHNDPSDEFLYGTVNWRELNEDQERDISDTLIHSLRDVNESISRHGYVTSEVRDFNRRLVRELGAAEIGDPDAPNNLIQIDNSHQSNPSLPWPTKALYGAGRVIYVGCESIERATLWVGRTVFQIGYSTKELFEYWGDHFNKDE